MAKPRTRKVPAISTVDHPAGETDLLTGGAGRTPIERAAEQDEIEILNQLRDEAGNGGYVRLSRRIDGSMDYAQVAKILIADYSMDRVQQVYGGGYYRLRFCTEDHKICGQRQLIIDPSLPFKNPAAPAVAAAPAQAQQDLVPLVKELLASRTTGPTGPGESTLVSLFTLMMNQQKDSNERFEKLMLALNNNHKPPGIDPLTLKLLELQLSKERTPMSELLESFSAFKKITGGKAGDDEDEPLTIWDKAGKVLGPIAEGLAAKYLVGEGSDEIVPRRTITAAAETPAAIRPVAEANGAEAPAGAVVTPFPLKPRPATPPMNALVQMRINQLMLAAVAAAKKNADPLAFAKELMDEIPPKFYEQVEAMAKTDDWFETLFAKPAPGGGAAYHPDALAAKEWLTKMRDSLLAELGEVLGPEEASPGGN